MTEVKGPSQGVLDAQEFNKKHRVGAPCTLKQDGVEVETQTISEASCRMGESVIMVSGIKWLVALSEVTVTGESKKPLPPEPQKDPKVTKAGKKVGRPKGSKNKKKRRAKA